MKYTKVVPPSLTEQTIVVDIPEPVVTSTVTGTTPIPGPDINESPTVSLGTDIEITLPTSSVTLNALATDKDGVVVRYEWSQVSGNTVPLTNPNLPVITIGNLAAGTYEFKCTVLDNENATGSDIVKVIVKPAVTVPPPVTKFEGFGATVTGGDGKPIRYVNPDDKGQYSNDAIRAAIGTGNCIVRFNGNGGTVEVRLEYSGIKNLTLDGGGKMTLVGASMVNGQMKSKYGGPTVAFYSSENIIVTGFKIYNSADDCLKFYGCKYFVAYKNCLNDASDGGCDITEGSEYGSIFENVFGNFDAGAILDAYRNKHTSIFRNEFTADDRNALVHNSTGAYPNYKPNPVDWLMMDFRNNVLPRFTYGTIISYGATANIVNNWYGKADSAININFYPTLKDGQSKAYVSGNIVKGGGSVGKGNVDTEFSIPTAYRIKEMTAAEALIYVKANAGTGNPDAKEKELLALIP